MSLSRLEHFKVCQRSRARERMAGVCRGDLRRLEKIDQLGRPQDCGQRQARREPFAEANQVCPDAVVFVSEPSTDAPEAGLNLVENEQHIVLVGPSAKLLDVLRRPWCSVRPLDGLHEDRRDLVRVNAPIGQLRHTRLQELLPVSRLRDWVAAVRRGTRHVMNGFIGTCQPRLACALSRELMRTECATVVVACVRQHVALTRVFPHSPLAGESQRTFARLGSGCPEVDFLTVGRSQLQQALGQGDPYLGRITELRQQSFLDVLLERPANRRVTVARVGHDGRGTEIDPAVPCRIVDLEALGAVPENRRLVTVHLREQVCRCGDRTESLSRGNRCHNPAIPRLDSRCLFRFAQEHISGG